MLQDEYSIGTIHKQREPDGEIPDLVDHPPKISLNQVVGSRRQGIRFYVITRAMSDGSGTPAEACPLLGAGR